MEVPNVSRQEFQLLDIDDGYLSLMTADGDTKDDVKVPEGELGDKLQSEFDEGKDLIVTIISAMVKKLLFLTKKLKRFCLSLNEKKNLDEKLLF